MRRVSIPADKREIVIDALGRSIGDAHALAPVIELLRDAEVEDGHATIIITDGEAETARAVIAVYASNFEKKLSIIFDDAPIVEVAVPKWIP